MSLSGTSIFVLISPGCIDPSISGPLKSDDVFPFVVMYGSSLSAPPAQEKQFGLFCFIEGKPNSADGLQADAFGPLRSPLGESKSGCEKSVFGIVTLASTSGTLVFTDAFGRSATSSSSPPLSTEGCEPLMSNPGPVVPAEISRFGRLLSSSGVETSGPDKSAFGLSTFILSPGVLIFPG